MFEFLRQSLQSTIRSMPFGRRSFVVYPDSFANNRKMLIEEIVQMAVERAGRGEWVVIAAQFANGFLELESALTARAANFTVLPPTISTEVLSGSRLMLGLTHSLRSLTDREFERAGNQPGESPTRLNVMVLQRHPLRKNDDAFTAALKLIPLHLRVGFFLSLDDPLLGVGVPEGVFEILRQMGMSNHQLISSHMLNRRVQATQRRVAAVVTDPKPADSVQEWMDINLPEPKPKKPKR